MTALIPIRPRFHAAARALIVSATRVVRVPVLLLALAAGSSPGWPR